MSNRMFPISAVPRHMIHTQARRNLRDEGVMTLGDLADYTAEQVLSTKGCGGTALNDVRSTLARYGLQLSEDHDPEPLWVSPEDHAKLEADNAALKKLTAHMCYDDHPKVHHEGMGDRDGCPVCWERNENDSLRAALNTALVDIHQAWDGDRDARVGKLIVAMRGGCMGYRKDTDLIAAFVNALPQPSAPDEQERGEGSRG